MPTGATPSDTTDVGGQATMTNQVETVTLTSVTIPEVLGPLLTAVCGFVLLSTAAIFVAGLFSWHRGGRPWLYGWWLRGLSLWTALLGGLSHALFWGGTYGNIGQAAMTPELWTVRQAEAYLRLAAPIAVALIAWTLGLCLGPRGRDREPPTTA